VRVRWDHLFDDLEGQLARELTLEESDLAAEEERLRLGRLELRERLIALHRESTGTTYRVVATLRGGARVTILPTSFGRDWMLADVMEGSRSVTGILPLAALESVSMTPGQVRDGLIPTAATDAPRIADRLGLSFVLRDLCRRRRFVEVRTGSAGVRGTIDRVGRDHCDIAIHEPPRRTTISEVRLVTFDSILLVTLA
jgi:hypothetical protein